MTTTHHTFCRICEALCGLEIDVDQGRVVDIRPDRAHVGTAGFCCAKGTRQARIYDSPDRLQYPLKRVGSGFERVSWEQALSEIGAGVAYSFYDAGLPGWQAVEIEVREGQVYLTGHLPSRNAARDAVELALQVPGVRGVISSLVVDG